MRVASLSLCLVLMASTASLTQAAEPVVSLDIPAQPLSAALHQLAEQTGLQLVYETRLALDHRSPAVVGSLSAREALERLLQGSGLQFQFLGDRTVAVSKPAGNEVGGRAARTGGNMLLAMAEPGQQAQGSAQAPAESGASAVDSSSIDTITVSATRSGATRVREIPASISIIDEAAIARNQLISTDPLDLLDATIPGMTPNSDSRGSGCTSKLRGRTAAFLINGVPLTQSLLVGSCSDAYNISPFAVERIEVNRGATAVYGYGAPGGVINMMTRRGTQEQPETNFRARTSLNTSAGSSWESEVYAGAGARAGRVDYYLGVGYGKDELRHDPRGQALTNQNITDSLGFDLTLGYALTEESELVGSLVWYRDDLGDYYGAGADAVDGVPYRGPVVHFPLASEDEAQRRNYVGTLSYRHRAVLNSALDIMLYVQDQHEVNRFSTYFDGVVYQDANYSDNDRFGVRTSMTTPLGSIGESREATVTYGIDYLENTTYMPYFDPADTSIILGFFSPEVTLETLSGFAQAKVPYGRLTFTGGARHERYEGSISDRGSEFGFVPGDGSGFAQPGDIPDFSLSLFNIGVIYDFNATSQMFAGISQGAQITEFSRAARDALDPSLINLQPAKATQYEVGYRYSGGRTDATIAAFFSESSLSANAGPDPSCAGQQICPLIPLRQPERYKGVEATLDFRVRDGLKVGGMFTYQDGEFRSPDTGIVEKVSTATVSPTRVTAYAEARLAPQLEGRLLANYTASRTPYETDDYYNGFINTDSYFVMDASLAYELGAGTLALSVSNLLDEKYVISTNAGNFGFFNILAEGRRVGLSYNMRF